MGRIGTLASRLPSTEQRLLVIWGIVLGESIAALEWFSFSHCLLLWMMGQASAALLMDWRKRLRRALCASEAPLQPGWMALHLASTAVWILAGSSPGLGILAGAAAFASLALALLPWPDLAAWRRSSYWAGTALGACAAAAGFALIVLAQMSWAGGIGSATLAALTFVLRCFDPNAGAIGQRLHAFGFAVTIEPGCSGLEGMVLIAAFTAAWLAWFRGEYCFPRALVLIPIGVALSWCLNIVRLAALMWIGAVAGRAAALGGFHSQAGWILFTALAISLCAVSLRLTALRRHAPDAVPRDEPDSLPVTAWLAPFVAIQAAATLSAAAQTDFEWLYPLRTVAGAAALGRFWNRIPRPKFDGASVAAGAAIAIAWATAALFTAPVTDVVAKLTLPEPWRTGWIVLRVLGAVAVVPVAEELAFRGIVQPRFGWLAASAAFGLLHGSRWLPGMLAGAALGWLKERCGLGGCIAAHLTANLLLFALVWISGDSRFW